MTEVETKLKKYEDFGYRLYKYYAEGEEIDPEIPSMQHYLNRLQLELSNDLLMLDKGGIGKTREVEINIALKKVKKWSSRKSKKAPDYFLVRTFLNYRDLSILPIDKKCYDVMVPRVNDDMIEITPTGEQVPVYIVPVIGSHHNDYVPLQDTDAIIMPAYLTEGQPYIHIREQILKESRVCPACGRIFKISYRQEKYFKDNGLELPKRCEPCRKKGYLL